MWQPLQQGRAAAALADVLLPAGDTPVEGRLRRTNGVPWAPHTPQQAALILEGKGPADGRLTAAALYGIATADVAAAASPEDLRGWSVAAGCGGGTDGVGLPALPTQLPDRQLAGMVVLDYAMRLRLGRLAADLGVDEPTDPAQLVADAGSALQGGADEVVGWLAELLAPAADGLPAAAVVRTAAATQRPAQALAALRCTL